MALWLVRIVVPMMIATSGAFMAVAWLGHLRFKGLTFIAALVISWAIVIPEYVLNVTATRLGNRTGAFTGAQMGAVHLCSGIVCVALVSRFMLGEPLSGQQIAGLGLLAVSLVLILSHVG